MKAFANVTVPEVVVYSIVTGPGDPPGLKKSIRVEPVYCTFPTVTPLSFRTPDMLLKPVPMMPITLSQPPGDAKGSVIEVMVGADCDLAIDGKIKSKARIAMMTGCLKAVNI